MRCSVWRSGGLPGQVLAWLPWKGLPYHNHNSPYRTPHPGPLCCTNHPTHGLSHIVAHSQAIRLPNLRTKHIAFHHAYSSSFYKPHRAADHRTHYGVQHWDIRLLGITVPAVPWRDLLQHHGGKVVQHVRERHVRQQARGGDGLCSVPWRHIQ